MGKNQLPDTPWKMGFVKKDENDPRKHKSRCVYYIDRQYFCGSSSCYMQKCIGSSHCKFYNIKTKEEAEEDESQKKIEFHVKYTFYRSKYCSKTIVHKGKKYYKIYLSETDVVFYPYDDNLTVSKLNLIVSELKENYKKGRKNEKI